MLTSETLRMCLSTSRPTISRMGLAGRLLSGQDSGTKAYSKDYFFNLPSQHEKWVPLVQLVSEGGEKTQFGGILFFGKKISARFFKDKAIILHSLLKNIKIFY